MYYKTPFRITEFQWGTVLIITAKRCRFRHLLWGIRGNIEGIPLNQKLTDLGYTLIVAYIGIWSLNVF